MKTALAVLLLASPLVAGGYVDRELIAKRKADKVAAKALEKAIKDQKPKKLADDIDALAIDADLKAVLLRMAALIDANSEAAAAPLKDKKDKVKE